MCCGFIFSVIHNNSDITGILFFFFGWLGGIVAMVSMKGVIDMYVHGGEYLNVV